MEVKERGRKRELRVSRGWGKLVDSAPLIAMAYEEDSCCINAVLLWLSYLLQSATIC